MKTIHVLAFAGLLASAVAYADETVVAPKSSKAVVAAAKVDAASADLNVSNAAKKALGNLRRTDK